MVEPAAKRDAVAHLKAVMALSEQQACQIIFRGPQDGPLPILPTAESRGQAARSRQQTATSATDGCSFCFSVIENHRASMRQSAIARRVFPFINGRRGDVRWCQSELKREPMHAMVSGFRPQSVRLRQALPRA